MKYWLAIAGIALITSCKQQQVTIAAIDKEVNEKLISGTGLDSNLFSRGDLFQYFQVEGYESASHEEVLQSASKLVEKDYSPLLQRKTYNSVTFYFYKQGTAYSTAAIYDAVRDSELGNIEGHNDDLLAKIIYSKLPGNAHAEIAQQYVYKGTIVVLEKTDTLKH